MSENETIKQYTSLLRLATVAAVVTAVILIIIKLYAWILTDSTAILASLIDSTIDLVASGVNFFVIHYSLMPADNEHRFGHGKAEPLAALAQSTFIVGSVVFLLLETTERLFNPQAVSNIDTGLIVMGLSTVATLMLVLLQRYVINKTQSSAIKADSMHYTSDLLGNVGIIIALVLGAYGFVGVDILAALLISLFLLIGAYKIGTDALNNLLDHSLPDNIEQDISNIATRHEWVNGIHELRTRKSGPMQFIQLHLELPESMMLKQAHAISDEIEAEILATYPNSDIIIHKDPVA